MPHDLEYGVADSDDGTAFATTFADAAVAFAEEGVGAGQACNDLGPLLVLGDLDRVEAREDTAIGSLSSRDPHQIMMFHLATMLQLTRGRMTLARDLVSRSEFRPQNCAQLASRLACPAPVHRR